MSDTIGRITIPALVDSGLTFPLTSRLRLWLRTGASGRGAPVRRARCESRAAICGGPGPAQARLPPPAPLDGRTQLPGHLLGEPRGAWKSFTYNVPNPDQTTTATKVTWEYAPLSIQYLANACQTGFNFIEVPDPAAAPTYAVASTCVRFPSTTLQTALLSQLQQIIPLIHIRVRESAVPDIYLSDRRCTSAAQLYLPRVLGLGEPGST